MKTIQLKNIETIVPEGAIKVTDLNQLEAGDIILKIWDNHKFPFGIEKNSRLVMEVSQVDSDGIAMKSSAVCYAYTSLLNATTATSGWMPRKSILEDKAFPHVIYKL